MTLHETRAFICLLIIGFSKLAVASDAVLEFRECSGQQEGADSQACLSKCAPLGSGPISYAADISNETVSETTWDGTKKLTQRSLRGCHILDQQNWRCTTQAEMMGGIVRRNLYAKAGLVFLEVSGSGGEQFYCSVNK